MPIFKRRTPERVGGQLRKQFINLDREDELLQAQRLAQVASRKAQLKGAMVIGLLHGQPHPRTFSSGVHEMLSHPGQQPSQGFMQFLQLLGELPEPKAKA